tara:strand:+ start:231 stop:812 length:582 start_codon:yes stop_codon:yes gene_type:complete
MKPFSFLSLLLVGTASIPFAVNADEKHYKGLYNSVSIGATKVSDIDFGSLGILQFKTGLETDIGIGYDFGKRFRLEGNYNRNGSDFENTTTSAGYVDLVTSTFSLNGLIDFPNTSSLTPFVGLGIGSSKIEVTGANDNVTSINVIAGASYKLTEKVDLVGKYNYRRFSDITLGNVTIIDSYTNSFLAGINFRF